MTTEELLKYHSELCLKGRQIMSEKNHDYCKGETDSPFFNLQMTEQFGVTTTEKGILTRTLDKIARLVTATNGKELKVKDESFDNSIIDAINYLVLLSAYVKEKNKKLVDSFIRDIQKQPNETAYVSPEIESQVNKLWDKHNF